MPAGDEMPPGQLGAPAGQDVEVESAVRCWDEYLEVRKRFMEEVPSAGQHLEMLESILARSLQEVLAAAQMSRAQMAELVPMMDALGLSVTRIEKAAQLQQTRAESYVEKYLASAAELQDARKLLIEDLLNHKLIIKEPSLIGIKMMGELEETPFEHACMRKHGNADDAKSKASALFSAWQDVLNNPFLRPFKVVQIDGITQEVVDEDDAGLMQLQEEYGDDVCSSVKVAVAELLEYNPMGNCPVPELWNFVEGRRATMADRAQLRLRSLK